MGKEVIKTCSHCGGDGTVSENEREMMIMNRIRLGKRKSR